MLTLNCTSETPVLAVSPMGRPTGLAQGRHQLQRTYEFQRPGTDLWTSGAHRLVEAPRTKVAQRITHSIRTTSRHPLPRPPFQHRFSPAKAELSELSNRIAKIAHGPAGTSAHHVA